MHGVHLTGLSAHHQWSATAAILCATSDSSKHGIRRAITKNTKPENLVRKALTSKGYRYRLHRKDLPGSPDIAMPGRRIVIFVHGCFWHRHECQYFKWPGSNKNFWRSKLLENVRRDAVAIGVLKLAGWRVCVLWECTLKQKTSGVVDRMLDRVAKWIRAPDNSKRKSWANLEIPSTQIR